MVSSNTQSSVGFADRDRRQDERRRHPDVHLLTHRECFVFSVVQLSATPDSRFLDWLRECNVVNEARHDKWFLGDHHDGACQVNICFCLPLVISNGMPFQLKNASLGYPAVIINCLLRISAASS